VLLARPDVVEQRAPDLRSFLRETGRGYRSAAENPTEAARMLAETADGPETLDDIDFLQQSQRQLADTYLTDDGAWGRMTEDRWAAFVDWLAGEEVLTTIEGNRRTRPSTHHGLFRVLPTPATAESRHPVTVRSQSWLSKSSSA
jgi:hypothetical protein